MLALPDELIGSLDFSYNLPVLKDSATDKQKIIYADFIKELIAENNGKNDLLAELTSKD